jgi:hypothetical protein
MQSGRVWITPSPGLACHASDRSPRRSKSNAWEAAWRWSYLGGRIQTRPQWVLWSLLSAQSCLHSERVQCRNWATSQDLACHVLPRSPGLV